MLGLKRNVGPRFIEVPGTDLLGEIAEQICLLSCRVTMAVLGDGDAACVRLDAEIAAGHAMDGIADFECKFAAGVWKNKVGDAQRSFGPADVDPLLKFGDERAVESRGYPTIEEHFA